MCDKTHHHATLLQLLVDLMKRVRELQGQLTSSLGDVLWGDDRGWRDIGVANAEVGLQEELQVARQKELLVQDLLHSYLVEDLWNRELF